MSYLVSRQQRKIWDYRILENINKIPKMDGDSLIPFSHLDIKIW